MDDQEVKNTRVPSDTEIRGYAAVSHGLVHYRCVGSGPPLVLLHDSPRSSLLHLPLMRMLAGYFSVFALDTPGYGRSDPLPIAPRPEIRDFAKVLGETLEALQLERPIVYAYHTSSKIALECAKQDPHRIGYLVIDGISLPPEPADTAFITKYMNPFAPDSTGMYITSHWCKIRDLHRFFPWFEFRVDRRLPIDEPCAEQMHVYALDYFMAGEDYPSAYSAAMRYDAHLTIRDLRVPATFMARADDVLYHFLDVVDSIRPPGTTVERLPPSQDVWREKLLEIFSTAAEEVGSDRRAMIADSLTRDRQYLQRGSEQIHVYLRGRGEPGLLLLTSPPGGGRAAESSISIFGGSRRVIAPDFAGCGGSDALHSDATFDDWVDWLSEIGTRMAGRTFDVVAQGMSVPFALALAARADGPVRRIAIDGMPVLNADERAELARHYVPTIHPRRDGVHFLSLFQRLRDEEIQWPWYENGRHAARHTEPELDPARLYSRLVDSLMSPESYGDACVAALSVDILMLARCVHSPLLVLDVQNDPAYRGLLQLSGEAPRGHYQQAPSQQSDRDEIMMAFLDAKE